PLLLAGGLPRLPLALPLLFEPAPLLVGGAGAADLVAPAHGAGLGAHGGAHRRGVAGRQAGDAARRRRGDEARVHAATAEDGGEVHPLELLQLRDLAETGEAAEEAAGVAADLGHQVAHRLVAGDEVADLLLGVARAP